MGQMLQDIFLGNFMIVLVTIGVLLMVTLWSWRIREFPGYILGWLVGIFMVILLSTLWQDSSPPVDSLPDSGPTGLDFLTLIFVSAVGLIAGFGALMLIKGGSATSSRVQRSLTIASLVSLPIIGSYLLLLSDHGMRLMLAAFLLAFSIGALLNFILMRGMPPRSAYVADNIESQSLPPDSAIERRMNQFRDRLRNRRPDGE